MLQVDVGGKDMGLAWVCTEGCCFLAPKPPTQNLCMYTSWQHVKCQSVVHMNDSIVVVEVAQTDKRASFLIEPKYAGLHPE